MAQIVAFTEEAAMEQAPIGNGCRSSPGSCSATTRAACSRSMVDIGDRTGLFEAAAKGAGTSEQIADRAGLNERYVREWLGAMATGGIMEYDAASRTFALPPEHAACLTGTIEPEPRGE